MDWLGWDEDQIKRQREAWLRDVLTCHVIRIREQNEWAANPANPANRSATAVANEHGNQGMDPSEKLRLIQDMMGRSPDDGS